MRKSKRLTFFVCFIGVALLLASCSNNNSYTNKKEKVRVDSVLDPLVKHYTERFEWINSLRVLDSIYINEKDKSIWLDNIYYSYRGWVNIRLHNYLLGIKYSDSLINIIESKHLQDLVSYNYSIAFLQKGNAYLALNNYNEAYQNYFKAKQIADHHNDCIGKFYLLEDIALVLYKQKQYVGAKNNYFEALACVRTCPEYKRSYDQQTLDDIALCYTKLNQLDSATYYYKLALENIEEFRFKNLEDSNNCAIRYASCRGVVLGNWAKILFVNGKLDSASRLYKEAIYLNTYKGNEKMDAQLCQVQLAKVQLKKTDYGGMKKSLDSLDKSLNNISNAEARLGWLEMMASYYQHTKNSAMEVKYYKDYIAMRDSINLSQKGSEENTINQVLKDKEQQFEITVLQKDNQLSRVYLWVVVVAFLAVAFIAFSIYRNFVKTKQLNQLINNQKIALEKANKAKDRILNVVAHDLRNPIGAIANFLDIVQLKYEHSKEEEQILKTSQQAAEHSLKLINELLEVNQLQDGELILAKTTVDVKQLVDVVMNELKHKVNAKQQTIQLQAGNENYWIEADAEKLQRVIANLIDNAIKFSEKGKEVVVRLTQAENTLQIKVKDSGMGIPANLIEQLFTTSIIVKRKGTNNEKSNGLGLSICKQIIEAHKGSILVESEVGKGSCFTVVLPV